MFKGLNRPLLPLECLGDGFVVIPFTFTINGTTHPTVFAGPISGVVRDEAGEFTLTLLDNSVPALCYFGDAGVSVTADDLLGPGRQ